MKNAVLSDLWIAYSQLSLLKNIRPNLIAIYRPIAAKKYGKRCFMKICTKTPRHYKKQQI
jgi:hypothetical protein